MCFRVQPAEFEKARARLGARLAHYGYAESEADYARLLWDANIVLSTAIHEFFGVSIVEAIYCGCLPILPRQLNYPELIPAEWHDRCLYDDFDGLLARMRAEWLLHRCRRHSALPQRGSTGKHWPQSTTRSWQRRGRSEWEKGSRGAEACLPIR